MFLHGRFNDHPAITIAQGKDLRRVILEKASNLFLADNLVIAVIDPDAADIKLLKPNLDLLKERAGLIIYLTSESREVCELLRRIACHSGKGQGQEDQGKSADGPQTQ